jgi:hypothetical protein
VTVRRGGSLLLIGLAIIVVGSRPAGAEEDPYPRLPPRVTLVVVPLDEDPATHGATRLLERLGSQILGLRDAKVFVTPRPQEMKDVYTLFEPLGVVSSRLDHRDLLLVVFCGGDWRGQRVRVGRHRLSIDALTHLTNRLVIAEKEEEDAYFRGTLALLFETTADVNAVRVARSSMRNTVLASLGTRKKERTWDRATVGAIARREPSLQAIPGFALDTLLGDGESYRPGLALFGLEILRLIFDPESKKTDLPTVIEGLRPLAERIAQRQHEHARLVAGTSFAARRGPGFYPEAFTTVLKDIRVYVDHAGRAGDDQDPAVLSSTLLSTYLSLQAGVLLSGGQGVFLLDREDYARADLTCLLVTFDGSVNVHCTQANGLTLAEADYDPKEFERAVPDLAVQLLKQFITVRSEEVELVLAGRPRHVALAVDRSWSSAFTDPTAALAPDLGRTDSIRKMAFLRVANELFHPSRAMATRNRLTLVFFSKEIELFLIEGADLAAKTDWSLATEELGRFWDEHARPQPGTDIGRALADAFAAFKEDLDRYDCHVLLFTDGVDTSRRNAREALAGVHEIFNEIHQKRGTVHGIGMAPSTSFLHRFKDDAQAHGPMLSAYLAMILGQEEAARCQEDESCRGYHAEGVGAYARTDLDWLREAIERAAGTSYEGVFAQMTNPDDVLVGLERIFARFRGGDVIGVTPSASRAEAPGQDRFSFKVDDEGDYEFVVSNQRELRDLRFKAQLDGADVTKRLEIDTSNPTQTVIRIRGAACGQWTIIREGRP